MARTSDRGTRGTQAASNYTEYFGNQASPLMSTSNLPPLSSLPLISSREPHPLLLLDMNRRGGSTWDAGFRQQQQQLGLKGDVDPSSLPIRMLLRNTGTGG